MPALTFIATANAVSYCGAIPHLLRFRSKGTLGIDVEKLDRYLARPRKSRRARAVTGAPAAGSRRSCRCTRSVIPPTWSVLSEVAERWHLPMIEDVAEALGTRYKGRHVGYHGMTAALSFNGNKVVTTGGGGAILTTDPAVARAAKHLMTTAKKPHQVGVPARSGRLQLPAAQYQCGARLRAA